MHNVSSLHSVLLLILLLQQVFLFDCNAQPEYYPFEIPQYNYIHYDINRFELAAQNAAFEDLFASFDSLLIAGRNQIRIVHIGGSHIQADIYTHRIRQHLQTFYPGINGARGFIFPYTIAKTNNPSNYSFTYTGQWESRTNTRSNSDLKLGLSGITVALKDSAATLTVFSRFDTLQAYDFNRVKIFCSVRSPEVVTLSPPGLVNQAAINDTLGYISFDLNKYIDTLHIGINASDLQKGTFELYGISLENDDPGVIYNTIGVNGATLDAFLRCELFVPHLQALEPDWVIVSIGTNDAYTRRFDDETFQSDYIALINLIREAAPDVALLLTVPNDSYLYRREVNRNTEEVKKIIFDLATEYDCGIWNFYNIMGGFNASSMWLISGLMNPDLVHFNRQGYMLKGDLFFNAFLNSWENHINE